MVGKGGRSVEPFSRLPPPPPPPSQPQPPPRPQLGTIPWPVYGQAVLRGLANDLLCISRATRSSLLRLDGPSGGEITQAMLLAEAQEQELIQRRLNDIVRDMDGKLWRRGPVGCLG